MAISLLETVMEGLFATKNMTQLGL